MLWSHRSSQSIVRRVTPAIRIWTSTIGGIADIEAEETPGNNIHERQVSGGRLAARYDLDWGAKQTLNLHKTLHSFQLCQELYNVISIIGKSRPTQKVEYIGGNETKTFPNCI